LFDPRNYNATPPRQQPIAEKSIADQKAGPMILSIFADAFLAMTKRSRSLGRGGARRNEKGEEKERGSGKGD
jgi:hypothetical protein